MSLPLRWGIFGCGKISWDFCVALSTFPQEHHVIEFVSAKDLSRAKNFASKFNVAKYSDNYEDVANDEDVNVCYVGTLHTTHKDLSVMALKKKKPVLCEKPVTLNLQELNEILACAKENNIFFMDAVWTRCFPLFRDIQSKLTSGYFGEPNVFMGTFGVEKLFDLERIHTPELGGGVLHEIGLYLLTVMDIIFKGYKMKDMKILSHVNEEGVDRSGGMTFLFEGNRLAHLLYNGDYHLPNEVKVLCSKGQIDIPEPFHCPERYTELLYESQTSKVNDFSLAPPPKEMFFPNSMGLAFEADHVRECLLEGKLESPLVPHETSIRIMTILDNLKEQIRNRPITPES